MKQKKYFLLLFHFTTAAVRTQGWDGRTDGQLKIGLDPSSRNSKSKKRTKTIHPSIEIEAKINPPSHPHHKQRIINMSSKTPFSGSVLIFGCGAICQCGLPIWLDKVDMPAEKITVIDMDASKKVRTLVLNRRGMQHEQHQPH